MTTLELLSIATEQKQGHGFRKHLGASLIGRECARQLWYVFRWATKVSFLARILWLFDRGNREEAVIVDRFRKAGIHILDIDPETGKQFRIEDHNGHFGGSLDAMIFSVPEYPDIWILGEFKTHSSKYFAQVKKQGVKKAKPEHYAQMNVYMHYKGLPVALYYAVNKDTDEVWIEFVEYDNSVAEKYIDRARRIIQAQFPPPRISDSPGWFLCKFCDHSAVCHDHKKKVVNCRTCVHSKPVEGSNWLCIMYDHILSEVEQRIACTNHSEIHED